MLVAGDGHHVRPVGGLHHYSSDLGAGDMEGGGTVLVCALDAGATVLTRILAMAEHTFLQQKQNSKASVVLPGSTLIAIHFVVSIDNYP